jgi:hypothetical protein
MSRASFAVFLSLGASVYALFPITNAMRLLSGSPRGAPEFKLI